MKKYVLLLVLLTAGLIWFGRQGLGGLPFEGKWSAGGPIGEADSTMAWFKTYDFSAGHYTMEGYPPISESGSYEVVLHEQDEYSNSYTLLLTPNQGDPEVGTPYLIEVDLRQDGTMRMGSLSVSASDSVFSR